MLQLQSFDSLVKFLKNPVNSALQNVQSNEDTTAKQLVLFLVTLLTMLYLHANNCSFKENCFTGS